jgi:rubrerythrin
MVGLTPFTGLALAMIIVIIMYFGIKLYVKKRTQSIENEIGEGICMECGSKVLDKKCPLCDCTQE